jgi:hypothetical protein
MSEVRAVEHGKSPLRVIACEPECFTVFGGEALDPVLVILQDFGGGRGRLTLECYGQAWSAYWGAMGNDNSLRGFLGGASHEYIGNCLIRGVRGSGSNKFIANQERYLLRIVKTVKQALRMQPEAPAP